MTSNEIVKTLRCCAKCGGCEECVIDKSFGDDACCKRDTEAADLIERLEKEKAALLEYARKCAGCAQCANYRPRCDVVDCFQCVENCTCRKCKRGSKWGWKGLDDSDREESKI